MNRSSLSSFESDVQALCDGLSLIDTHHPFYPRVVVFLSKLVSPLPDDHKTIASLAARIWLDQIMVSIGKTIQSEVTLSTGDLPELSTLREAAVLRNQQTAISSDETSTPIRTLHITELGRVRNKELYLLNRDPPIRRALACRPWDMFRSSPFAYIQRREGRAPYPRVGFREDRLFNGVLNRLSSDYFTFQRSGLDTPPPPSALVVDLNISADLLQAHATSRALKNKPPLSGPHHRLSPLALVHAHLLANKIRQCSYCLDGTCYIFHIAVLAEGAPIPFLGAEFGDDRPALSTHPSVYPLSLADQPTVAGELGGYLAQGVFVRVDVNRPTYDHPSFCVWKQRFAPSDKELRDLYSQVSGPLDQFLLSRADGVVASAIAIHSQRSDLSTERTIDAASLSEALRPERTEQKPRMVIDYGRLPRFGGPSFNDRIADWKFAYCHLGYILSLIRPGMWIASVDISAAFVLIPTHPEDEDFLATRFPASGAMGPDGQLIPGDHWLKFVQKRHLFGSKHLPALFSTISAEIVDVLKRRSLAYAPDGSVVFVAYVDDIFILCDTLPLCEKAGDDLRSYMKFIGAELNDKSRLPSQTQIPILGLEVDTLAMTVSLPLPKAYSTAFLCAVALQMLRRDLRPPDNFWDKLFGKLEHACYAIPGGSGRLASIRHAVHDSSLGSGSSWSQFPHLFINLEWWLRSLSLALPCARLFMSCAPSSPAYELRTKSDASGSLGGSLHCADRLILHAFWTKEISENPSIQLKELYPMVLFLECYGYLLSGLSFPFGTDNLPNVFAVNKRTMSDRVALSWLTYLCDLSDHFHVLLLPSWVPREDNVEADVSSKVDSLSKLLSLYPSYSLLL